MYSCSNSQSGLSLIEAIIFILILSVGLTGVISVYIYTTKHSANTMLSLKTVELSQALMDEILSKGYDENTPLGGGCVDGYASTLCTSAITAQATVLLNFGVDAVSETRAKFDDVDDYHNLAYCGEGVTAPDPKCTGGCPASPSFIDETGADISADYRGYSICIRVSFAGDEMNAITPAPPPLTLVDVATNDAKRIDLIIRDPVDSVLTFTAYKANF